MVSTASIALFRQGRRLGNKPVKFSFYKTTGPNHCTFVLLPRAGQDYVVHTADECPCPCPWQGVEMS